MNLLLFFSVVPCNDFLWLQKSTKQTDFSLHNSSRKLWYIMKNSGWLSHSWETNFSYFDLKVEEIWNTGLLTGSQLSHCNKVFRSPVNYKVSCLWVREAAEEADVYRVGQAESIAYSSVRQRDTVNVTLFWHTGLAFFGYNLSSEKLTACFVRNVLRMWRLKKQDEFCVKLKIYLS